MKVAVLALQGAFIEHVKVLNQLGVETIEIRKKSDLLQEFDGLVIPGGESTVIGKLLCELDLFDDIKNLIIKGMPVLGTCAGLILLAKNIEHQDTSYLGVLDITVVRNAFGRQYDSFCVTENYRGKEIEMPFIRAPYIKEIGDKVQVLSMVDEKITGVRQGNILGLAFHPELTGEDIVHRHFIEIINERNQE